MRDNVNNSSISNTSGYVFVPNDNTHIPHVPWRTAPVVPTQYVYPAVCPGCGRCNTCGRPKESEFKITYGQTK